jgi:hypothetical protein
MQLISHRGNLQGRKPNLENSPDYIQHALDSGVDVEIDVHVVNREFWLGHDEPTYKVEEVFLTNPKLWCHAKTLGALNMMLDNKNIHCFWHQEDSYTLTSQGYVWTYPNEPLCSKSICVMPSEPYKFEKNIHGICSDNILHYKK